MSETGHRKARLDRWLWAARFFKTRSQSAAAVKGGKVDVDGKRAKPSLQIGVGSRLEVRKGPYRWVVDVLGVADKRGSAEMARRLYIEDPDSEREREQTRARIRAERAAMPRRLAGQGRPTKKQRRELMAFREQFFHPEEWGDLDDDSGGEVG